MWTVSNLYDNPGSRKKRKRVGRGIGSGKGKTCGRGGKGQTARSGVAIKGFEGGQMPIYRRLPRRGFVNHSRVSYHAINISVLLDFIESGKIDRYVRLADLRFNGLVKGFRKLVKIVGKTPINHSISVEANAFSKGARDAIEAAGGTASIVI